MMYDSTDHGGREERGIADGRDGPFGISDEELSVALRAAGASPEDVQRYLRGEPARSGDRA